MQSGISVSQDLHDAFTTFASDPSIFCLPVTITSESLTPLPTIPFSAPTGSPDRFYPSLARLSSVLEPKTPVYLLLRRPESSGSSPVSGSRSGSPAGSRSPSVSGLRRTGSGLGVGVGGGGGAGNGNGTLIALTYIPSNAGVRAKTLFASTRATLVRELGSEKFAETIFATEEEEIVGEGAWRERDAQKSRGSSGGDGVGFRREDLMGEKERELEAVRRAEDAARSGTPGRDIGIGGSFSRGPARMKIEMQVDEEVKGALEGLRAGGLVQLAIDVATESFKLAAAEDSVDPDSVQTHIAPSSPRYTFYHYPDSDTVIFIYTCPSGSSIKERMLYASSRMHALQVAEEQGLKILKKIEASSPDEVTGDRLQEEVNPPQNDGPRRGFARPKRPGR